MAYHRFKFLESEKSAYDRQVAEGPKSAKPFARQLESAGHLHDNLSDDQASEVINDRGDLQQNDGSSGLSEYEQTIVLLKSREKSQAIIDLSYLNAEKRFQKYNKVMAYLATAVLLVVAFNLLCSIFIPSSGFAYKVIRSGNLITSALTFAGIGLSFLNVRVQDWKLVFIFHFAGPYGLLITKLCELWKEYPDWSYVYYAVFNKGCVALLIAYIFYQSFYEEKYEKRFF